MAIREPRNTSKNHIGMKETPRQSPTAVTSRHQEEDDPHRSWSEPSSGQEGPEKKKKKKNRRREGH